MAFSTSDLAKLDEAIASGVKRVEYPGGQTIEYQSISDMLKARRAMILEINSANNAKPYSVVAFK